MFSIDSESDDYGLEDWESGYFKFHLLKKDEKYFYEFYSTTYEIPTLYFQAFQVFQEYLVDYNCKEWSTDLFRAI